jgi:hypothetical protein
MPFRTHPYGSFQSHWNCATPSIAPTSRDLLSGPPINNNTTFTSSISSLLTIQEHSPSCPCDRFTPLPIQDPPYPTTPIQSPCLTWYPYQRVSPRQVPSPRVVPRMNPVDVASARVAHKLPQNSVIPLTPHPAAAYSPYVPQGTAGVNLFGTFEEEHMETPSLPRYNTRARA